MLHILCPVDFSEASLNALDHAAHITHMCKGALTLIYVFDEEEFIQIAKVPLQEEELLHSEAEARLKSLVKGIRESESVTDIYEVNYMMRVGDLVSGIIDYTTKEQIELIVMGTTGVGTVRQAFMGSNTVKVFEKAPCPVLCVPSDATYQPISHIVYATDYERDDQVTVKKVLALAQNFKAKVEVVHVEPTPSADSDIRYQQYVEHLSSYFTDKNLRFQRETCQGEVSNCLDAYMNRSGAQILTLLTHNRNLLQKLVHKSITKNLSYFTDSPLLIYKN